MTGTDAPGPPDGSSSPPDDPFLRRLERDAVVCCLVAAAVALALRGGRPDAAVAVLAGGLLTAVSYWAIKGGVVGLMRAMRPAEEAPRTRTRSWRRSGWPIAKIVGRYALLAGMAYVMIARLRLHPIGLLTGASSIVAAAAVEAVRAIARPGRTMS